MVIPSFPRTNSASRLLHHLQVLATHDVFPEFSARVRRVLYNPLGVLLFAALIALLCGLFLHSQGFILFGGVLAVIFLGLAWPWWSLRGLSGVLSFSHARIREGEPVQVSLHLRNRWLSGAWGLSVREGFSRDSHVVPPSPIATIASLPRRCQAGCGWTFVPTSRGVYPLSPPRLTTGFPFGLWENRRTLQVQAPLLVWPRTVPVGPVPLVEGNPRCEGNVSRNKVGSNGDVLGVRPYRRGDSPRRIHWGQSARHDRLIVCELQSNARPLVQLILDTHPDGHVGTGPNSSREWAIRIAASFAQGWLEEGAQISAVWHGQSFAAASGQLHLQRLLDALARLPDGPGPSLTETLRSPVCRGFREGLQVIITTDRSLVELPSRFVEKDQQRWVVLHQAGFAHSASSLHPLAHLPVTPWLWIDSPERIPTLLHGCWKEARHGS